MNQNGRCLGRGRCVRQHVSTSENYKEKLEQLARSCEMDPARLADKLLYYGLNSPQYVYALQKAYNVEEHLFLSVIYDKQKRVYHYKYGAPSLTKRNVPALLTDKFLRGPRSYRFTISINLDTNKKLGLLAKSCRTKNGTLAALIINNSLDSENLILKMQDMYNKNPRYRVILFDEMGETRYMLMT